MSGIGGGRLVELTQSTLFFLFGVSHGAKVGRHVVLRHLAEYNLGYVQRRLHSQVCSNSKEQDARGNQKEF